MIRAHDFGPRSPAEFDFRNIVYEKRGNRATVVINRPEVLNALDFGTLKEMSAAFEDASYDDDLRALVLTGAGDRAFCTGADLDEQMQFLGRPHDYWKWMGAFIEAHDRLRNLGKPTVARLNGMVVGGGNEFNIACDLAVAADDITIRQVGAARGSVAAGGATQWLPLVIGDRRAREMLYLCEPIPARQALEWGLVNEVVRRGELDAATDRLVEKLVDKLPECTRYTKQQLNFWRDLAWGLTVGHARDWLTLHSGMAETAEGLRAFHEKRPVEYAMLRERLHEPTRVCPSCGAVALPAEHRFCGICGAALERSG